MGVGPCETSSMSPTPRSTVRRLAELAVYDREVVAEILDAGLVAHVGISHSGAPVVIPMVYARIGETVYLHGSTASRMMRKLRSGDPMCITVTVVDGIVLARSAFNMSMNYRAVVVQGVARVVTEDAVHHCHGVGRTAQVWHDRPAGGRSRRAGE